MPGEPSTGGSLPNKRRRSSQSTLASVDIPHSPFSPLRLGAILLKHGKYVAAGATGVWWLDIRAAARHIVESPDSWTRRALVAAVGFHGVTVILFLYLVLFLPWLRGYTPNYPKWQQSARLRLIVPLLTSAILLGWFTLVYALSHTSYPKPRGAIRDSIREALNVDDDGTAGLSVFGAMLGATAVYTLTFGLLGFIPSPNAPVRVKKS
ncbi:uncharacterized protein LOC62_03G004869 [Vanrija pseudolonga]|uniref:Uncharacterized protein n=1 Tax=Vanrija pseudolonga TaxID=143232 RepID=A0AAF0Y7H4_9TREE|nr:hypothetical protein LOC62_03G004869 [Vanrija pseudolonga]